MRSISSVLLATSTSRLSSTTPREEATLYGPRVDEWTPRSTTLLEEGHVEGHHGKYRLPYFDWLNCHIHAYTLKRWSEKKPGVRKQLD